MVVSKKNRQLRSFKVIAVQNVSGCVTKFKAGRYTSSNPMSAAKKAFTRLCNLKKIKNKCTFIISIQDTTNDASTKGKEFTYKIDRLKLKKPIIRFEGEENEYKILYGVTAKKSKPIDKCVEGRKRTRGPMRKYSKRQNAIKARKQKKLKFHKKRTIIKIIIIITIIITIKIITIIIITKIIIITIIMIKIIMK